MISRTPLWIAAFWLLCAAPAQGLPGADLPSASAPARELYRAGHAALEAIRTIRGRISMSRIGVPGWRAG